MLKLSSRWAEYLASKPEAGMGYQIASIILKDGRSFQQVIINSGFITQIKTYKTIPFEENEIAQIIITNNKI